MYRDVADAVESYIERRQEKKAQSAVSWQRCKCNVELIIDNPRLNISQAEDPGDKIACHITPTEEEEDRQAAVEEKEDQQTAESHLITQQILTSHQGAEDLAAVGHLLEAEDRQRPDSRPIQYISFKQIERIKMILDTLMHRSAQNLRVCLTK